MSRRVNMLSAVTIAKSKSAGMYADGGGLYLQVSNAGSKSWVFRFRFQGRRRDMGLGALPSVGLVAARDRAFECRRLLMQGADPIEARNAERRSIQTRGVTFRQAFETFFGLKRKSLSNAKHLKQWPATMSAYVFPSIGDRPVAEVQTGEILDVLTPVWFEKPETGRRLLQRIEAVFKSAILRGHRERASPCIGVVQELGNRHRAVVNHRSLPYQEVPDFIAELRNSKCLPATRLAFEWLILTATRSGETRLANWKEIDERSGLWTLSPERTKARRRHVVPLSPRCLEILSEARACYSESLLIFPGSKPGAPLSDMTLTKVLRDMGLAHRATPHGFRSSFKTWCAEVARVRDEVSEACLAHQIKDKVKAAYLRSDFLDERRPLMATWSMHCASPASQSAKPPGIPYDPLLGTVAARDLEEV
jgi:integrase